MSSRPASMILVALALFGCPAKEERKESATQLSSSANAPQADKASDTAPGHPPDTAAKAKAVATSSFSGKYELKVGTIYIPDAKDWSSVKFKNDERQMLGEGSLQLTIDAAGRVTGGTDTGPLGASVFEGVREGSAIAATIRRKDPSDEGLTGTLYAKIEGDKLEGTMNLAESNASVVRTASWSAARK